jgi:hypothetical protein
MLRILVCRRTSGDERSVVGSGWHGADLHAQQIPISIQLIMSHGISIIRQNLISLEKLNKI